MSSKWKLENRIALVTGGTKGIGRAIAEEIMQLGGIPYIVSRNQDDIDSSPIFTVLKSPKK